MGDGTENGGAKHRAARARRRALWRTYAVPAVALLCLALPHLGQGDFRTDTARYAAVGLQAWRTGELLTLRLQPEVPYYAKPPLALWIHGWFLHRFGVSLAVAQAPSVLAALGCVLLLVRLARVWFTRGRAMTAGLVLALTYEFFRRTREISLDLWQLLFLLAAAVLFAEALRRKRPVAWAAACGFPLGLALLCKPLVALLALPVFSLWALLARRPRRAAAPLAALPVALLVAAAWYGPMLDRHGRTFVQQHFGAEIADRATGYTNREPPAYYLRETFGTYWPWLLPFAGGLAAGARGRSRGRGDRGVAMALAWTACWALALSLFPDKRPRYALPLLPLMAMPAAVGLHAWRWLPFARWRDRGYPRLGAALIVLGLAAAAAPLQIIGPPSPQWPALFAWMREQGLCQLHLGHLGTNDQARFYLAFGRWPVVGRPAGPGDYLIYRRRAYTATPTQSVVFTVHDLLVARQKPAPRQLTTDDVPGPAGANETMGARGGAVE